MFRINELEIIKFDETKLDDALSWAIESISKISNEELFLPVDFNKSLATFKNHRSEYENLPYSYKGDKQDAKTKAAYFASKSDVEDKLFFCMNLCNHKEMCEAWKQAQNEYLHIVGDKT